MRLLGGGASIYVGNEKCSGKAFTIVWWQCQSHGVGEPLRQYDISFRSAMEVVDCQVAPPLSVIDEAVSTMRMIPADNAFIMLCSAPTSCSDSCSGGDGSELKVNHAAHLV